MGTYSNSVIIVRGLVYPKEFVSPGILSAFTTTGYILMLMSCNVKNILFFPFMTVGMCCYKDEGENNLHKPIRQLLNNQCLPFLFSIFSVEEESEVM